MRMAAIAALSMAMLPAAALAAIEVNEAAGKATFALVSAKRMTPIVIDEDDHRVIAIAAACLADDVERISGQKPRVVHARPGGGAVIIGSLDRSRHIRALVDAKKLDLADMRGQWESFKIVRVDDDLVIVGSDRRGAAYGALELSRAIGVSPWYWWADVPPRRRAEIHLACDSARMGPPSVKYRGVFLNDEDWGLQPWAAKTFESEVGDIGPRTYARIFELLLRLKANYCWPAMHECSAAFNADPRNRQVADDYAIVMGSSHCEQMLRNNVREWSKEKLGEWDPVTNMPAISRYWEERVRDNAKFESVWTVGMRGIHDGGMPGGGTLDQKRSRLEEIIALQRDMLARHVNPDAAAVPQIFCPYKEVLDVYRSGMSLPDDITIVWPDDNFGHIRQLSDERERKRGGRSGVYYHLSYNGRPHDYLWLESIPPALVWHEMSKAHELGADRVWVANVGDIKPIEAGMTLFLEMAWNIDRYGADVSRAFLRDFYGEQFGESHAQELADIKREYFRLCAIRKPETLGWNRTYRTTPVRDGEFSNSPENDEAMRFVEQWTALAARADALAARLEPQQRPAYFQLVQYSACAGSAMAQKMIFAERSRLLTARGDATANGFADQAEASAAKIEELTRAYNEQRDGKWRHMMDHRPRELPVFGPPIVARVDSGSTASSPTKPISSSPPTIEIDITRPTRLIGQDVRWHVIEGLGWRGAAITMLPRLHDPVAAAPIAEYAVEISGGPTDYDVVVEALPTQPMTSQHKLVCGISFDDATAQTLSFAQASDEHDATWQQNVLRNVMFARGRANLARGKHVLRLWGMDASVAVQNIALIAAAAPPPASAPAAEFSKKLPEGNHLVTISFGDDTELTDTTVKAEARRLMLESVRTRTGETVKQSFVVNIRTPRIKGDGEVRLNAREIGTKKWDDQLTLEFLGPRPGVRDVQVEPAPAETITVYLAGDSTVTDQVGEPWTGWGQMLPRFFKPTVAIANHAESGRALRSFRNEKRLDKILSTIKPGDYLFIQFGHNDMKEKGEGIGAFTSFKTDLTKYIAAAREKGANPVVITSMHRRRFDEHFKIVNTFGDYIEATRQAAAETGTPLIDLNAMSKTLYETWGSQESKKAFVHYPAGTFPNQKGPLKDDTHFNAYGGYELARCVVEGIRAAKLPLAEHLANDVKPFDPAHPDPIDSIKIPPSPERQTETPAGR